MKRSVQVLALMAAATMFAGRAWADTTWNLNASFTYDNTANTATGTITLDPSLDLVTYDVTVSGTNVLADNEYTSLDSFAYFPDLTHLDFYDFGTNQNINLYLSSPFTNAGGTITLLAGDDGASINSTIVCAGCGVLSQGTLSTTVAATPEPGSMALLGTAICALGAWGVRRRRCCF